MKASVFVAIFSGSERDGWINPALAKFLIALSHHAQERKVTANICCDPQPIDYKRNFIAGEFLKSDCEWLLQVDNDQSVPMDILRMLDWAPHDAHIVVPMNFKAASLPNGGVAVQPVWEPLGAPTNEAWQELRACGTGVMAVRREAFERIGTEGPWFRFEYDDFGKVTKAEDIGFCESARAVGCRIVGNKSFVVEHYKTVSLASLAPQAKR
jgi:GT2 family glycosyltransferase